MVPLPDKFSAPPSSPADRVRLLAVTSNPPPEAVEVPLRLMPPATVISPALASSLTVAPSMPEPELLAVIPVLVTLILPVKERTIIKPAWAVAANGVVLMPDRVMPVPALSATSPT